ncbi:MAG: DNA polymerase III subunit chi [Rhodospirillales bacterium]|nr:DNA polymerase III subunit chi [Rhodospirillales bacterium]
MTDIAFYHLQRSPLEKALPMLLEKTLEAGKRAVVMAGSTQRVDALNSLLWTYEPNSWLPHGSAKDGAPVDQLIWLTTDDDAPNGATFLFLSDGATSEKVSDFERCFELFDGNDDDEVSAARGRWKTYKDAGHTLTYWQQNERGGWEKKA